MYSLEGLYSLLNFLVNCMTVFAQQCASGIRLDLVALSQLYRGSSPR
jgi:hypothetical protein